MIKENTENNAIQSATGRVRAVCFNWNESDPYILYHPSPDELSDEAMRRYYAEWQNIRQETPDGNDDDEERDEDAGFESFLDWLESEKNFISLTVAERMINFD